MDILLEKALVVLDGMATMPIGAEFEHTIFGGMIGIWIGYIFADRFPKLSLKGLIFIALSLFIVAVTILMLHTAFSRPSTGARIFFYGVSIVQSALFVAAVMHFFSDPDVYDQTNPPSTERLWFLLFIVVFWAASAEAGILVEKVRISLAAP